MHECVAYGFGLNYLFRMTGLHSAVIFVIMRYFAESDCTIKSFYIHNQQVSLGLACEAGSSWSCPKCTVNGHCCIVTVEVNFV